MITGTNRRNVTNGLVPKYGGEYLDIPKRPAPEPLIFVFPWFSLSII